MYRKKAINRSEQEQGLYALHRMLWVSTFAVLRLRGKWVFNYLEQAICPMICAWLRVELPNLPWKKSEHLIPVPLSLLLYSYFRIAGDDRHLYA